MYYNHDVFFILFPLENSLLCITQMYIYTIYLSIRIVNKRNSILVQENSAWHSR